MTTKNNSSNHKRLKIAEDLEAKLLLESKNTCNFCWKSNEVQIHHIIPLCDGGTNAEENLIVLCLNCHSKVHTKKGMAKNIGTKTLRLYKETWIEKVRSYPLGYIALVDNDDDIALIRKILMQGNRRALYFPIDLEIACQMFESIDNLRLFIQKSGYKLIRNAHAREHIQQIYKSLIEISFLNPAPPQKRYCLHGIIGRNNLQLLIIKRKEAIYHLNELGRIIGYAENLFQENEFEQLGIDILPSMNASRRCFGSYSQNKKECKACEFVDECIEVS